MVQMPRFGKTYKMFSQIIPSTELDVTDLLHNCKFESLGQLLCFRAFLMGYAQFKYGNFGGGECSVIKNKGTVSRGQ